MFESHGGLLSAESFATYCLPYLGQIAQRVKEKLSKSKLPVVPMTVFAKGSHYAVEELSRLEYDVIGIDWTINPNDAR